MKNKIGTYQSFALYTIYIFGSIATIGGQNEAGKDAYLAFLAGGLASLPIYKLYMSNTLKNGCGAKYEKALMLILGIFSIFVASVSQAVLILFISQMNLVLTPHIIIAAFIAASVMYIGIKGVTVLARCAEILFPLTAAMMIFAALSSVHQADFTLLLPIFQKGILNFLNGAFTSFMFPFAEGFFAVFMINRCTEGKKGQNGVRASVIFCSVFLAVFFANNMAVLGVPFASQLYFPSYAVVSLVTLSSFFQRLEIFMAVVFMVCQLFKICMLTIFAREAVEEVRGHKMAFFPIVAIVFNVSLLMFKGITAAFEFLLVYRYIMTVGVLVCPVLLFLARKAKRDREEAKKEQAEI